MERVIDRTRYKNLLFIFSILLCVSCEHAFFHDVKIKANPNNALIINIDFQTQSDSDCYLSYWSIGQENEIQYSKLSKANRNHELTLINLIPQQKYNFIIHAKHDNTLHSKPYSFSTDTLPSAIPDYKLTLNDYSFDGYILLKKYNDPGAFVLLNDAAQVVWYYPYKSSVLRAFDWSDEKSIVSLTDSTTIEEFDLYGKKINEVNIKTAGIPKRIHHELFKNNDGQYVFLNYDYMYPDLSQLGGGKLDTIRTDGLMIVDQKGKLMWGWSVFDVLDPLSDPNIIQYKSDWGHANSISYHADGNFILSFRDFNQVWKISGSTGEIMWRIGEQGDFNLSVNNQTIKQHAAHINPKGELMVFDNGNADRGYSRVISYLLDEANGTAEVKTDFSLDKSMTTFRMGSAYMIDDNHILVCSPRKRLGLGIYDLEGNLVWKVEGSSDSYRALYLEKSDVENSKPF